MANTNLRSAWRKVRQFMDGREWVGCLTPCEALALMEEGATVRSSFPSKEHLLECKATGQCNPTWFYFYPTKQQLTKWRG